MISRSLFVRGRVPALRRCYATSSGPIHSLPSSPSTRYAQPTHTALTSDSTINLASEYLLGVYARPPFVLSHGKGSYVWDTDNRKFLDFTAGIAVNALGHADAGVSKTLTEQSAKLLHTSNVYYHEPGAKLAELLISLTRQEGGLGFAPGSTTGGGKVFFANSGTEANEGALKIARKVGKDRWLSSMEDCEKIGITCFERSFHGRSMGALSVTSNPKYQKPFAPLLPGVQVGKLNDMGSISSLVHEKTCAVILEPIQGEGGINAAEIEWLRELRKRCDDVGAVLIFDEIQCGLYRTGTLWAHSSLPVDCHPDIVTMAKPLANGYPIGAVLLRDEIASTMTPGTHGTTFGGSPLACAVGHHVLTRLSARPFIAHMMEMSAYLVARLEQLPKWFPKILESKVRGRGLILGLGFHDQSHPGQLVKFARERGVFLLTAGSDAVRLVPSLNVEKEDIDLAVDVMESCLMEMSK